MARSIGTTLIVSNGTKMRAKQIGHTVDRNPAIHRSKSRNKMLMNTQKLLNKGRLIPIYKVEGDTILLMGYRRKARSRKAHQRPFMLKSGVPIAKIPPNPETK